MAYGTDIGDQFRLAATYVAKILRGAAPRDLPVQEPTKFELIINPKTARALGLTIPASLVQRADQVIERLGGSVHQPGRFRGHLSVAGTGAR
jgi:putative ABC transport system substrate-binding protein